MKLKLLVHILALKLFVVGGTLAAPFINLSGFYYNGLGCVMFLLECTPPYGSNDGRVAFIHRGDLGYGSEYIYNIQYDSSQWGNYGFLGTGINYTTTDVWDGWNDFWAPWGDPIQ